MAIKSIIAKGIGYGPGNLSFVVTHGFSISEEVAPSHQILTRRGRRRMLIPFILSVLHGLFNS